jgi:hypothetical protein
MVDPGVSVAKLRRLAERLVTLLDDRFRIPGTNFRFGLDPIIGVLFPGIGDAVTGVGSIGLLVLALLRGVPRVVLFRMIFNIVLDAIVGLLPFVGDVFDAVFKANRRNLELIRQHGGPESKPTTWDYVIVTLGISLAVLGIAVPFVALLYFGVTWVPELLEHLRPR